MRNDPSGNNFIDKINQWWSNISQSIDNNELFGHYAETQVNMGKFYASDEYRNLVIGGYAVAAGGAAAIAFAPEIAAAGTSAYVAVTNFSTSHPTLVKSAEIASKVDDMVGCAAGDPVACAGGVPGMANLKFNISDIRSNISGGEFNGTPFDISIGNSGRSATISRASQIIDIDLDDPTLQRTITDLTAVYNTGGNVGQAINNIFYDANNYDSWVDSKGGRYSLGEAILNGTGVCIDQSCLKHVLNAANGVGSEIYIASQPKKYRGKVPGHATLKSAGLSHSQVWNQLNGAFGLSKAKAVNMQSINMFAE